MWIEQLAQTPIVYASILGILGLCIGSFINVISLRLPAQLHHSWREQARHILQLKPPSNESETTPPGFVTSRSHCPNCNALIKWWQNIPVLSYLFLRAKCHQCRHKISSRYPLVEILTASLTIIAGLTFPSSGILGWVLVATWLLITMSLIDIDTQLLPDNLTLPLLWLGLIFNTTPHAFVSPTQSIIGATVGYLSLWVIYHLHRLITGKEGMGYGDFKLFSAAGAWLGWMALPLLLLIAATSGLFFALIRLSLHLQNSTQAIAFGPHLALGFLVCLFWGDSLISQYFSFMARIF